MPTTVYHIRLTGDVGGDDFDAAKVDKVLDAFPDEPVSILINSTGGRLATGMSISAALRRHACASVHFVGLNASAATIASLGARRITMDRSALYLIHRCSIPVLKLTSANEEELDALIAEFSKSREDLRAIDRCIAAMYADRCRKPAAELAELMKE